MSATWAYAALLFAALSCCADAVVDVPAPSLNDSEDTCIQMLPSSDPENVTYDCETVTGKPLWQLGDYQMVDQDEFGGIVILANTNMSSLTIHPHGITFLFGELQSDVMTVTCYAVVDEVNLKASPTVLVYADVTPNLPPPVHKVTECHDDGSYTVDVRYQRLSSDEYCADIVNYTLSASSGTALSESCSGAVCVFGPEDDLSMGVIVNNTADYAVTLEVCTATVCREDTTLLTDLTCSQPTWGICSGQANLSCNFPDGIVSGWRCNFTSTEVGDIAVVDVFNGRVGGQSRIPSFDSNFDCPVAAVVDEENLALIIGASVGALVGGLLVGAVAAVIVTLLVLKWCQDDGEAEDNVELKKK